MFFLVRASNRKRTRERSFDHRSIERASERATKQAGELTCRTSFPASFQFESIRLSNNRANVLKSLHAFKLLSKSVRVFLFVVRGTVRML